MIVKVAVACDGLAIAPYFAQSTSYTVYTVKDGRVMESRNLPVFDRSGSQLPTLLDSIGVGTFIAGGIDNGTVSALHSSDIDVVSDAAGDPLSAVRGYLSNVLCAVED